MPELAVRLADVMDALAADADAILVDDGSRDRSYQLMLEAAEKDRRLRVVRLSRSFGHQIALTAGVDLAAGDAVVVMDADLQDPPGVIALRRKLCGGQAAFLLKDKGSADSQSSRATCA